MVVKKTKDKKKHFKYHIFGKKWFTNIYENLQFCAYFESGVQLQRNKTSI